MFEKNLEFLEEEETERIRGVRAAVIGLGALGQMAAHELVRGGMERLTLVDGDVMEQSNLNRQLYADILTILSDYFTGIWSSCTNISSLR